jgi:hypothetical protein
MKIFFIFALSLFYFVPSDVLALEYCSCNPESTTTEQRFNRSFATFIGEVDEISREVNPDRYKVTFNILRSWKGVKFEKASVFTDVTDAITTVRTGSFTCGYNFQKGRQYLIFSHRNSKAKGPSWVSACGGVIPLEQATSELVYLDSLPTFDLKERR